MCVCVHVLCKDAYLARVSDNQVCMYACMNFQTLIYMAKGCVCVCMKTYVDGQTYIIDTHVQIMYVYMQIHELSMYMYIYVYNGTDLVVEPAVNHVVGVTSSLEVD